MISFHGRLLPLAGGGEVCGLGPDGHLPHLMNISTQAVTRGDQATARGDPATVALVTLGCARNDVDSESSPRGSRWGFRLVAEADQAETVVVNTCGFVEAAKKDSIDALLGAAEGGRPVAGRRRGRLPRRALRPGPCRKSPRGGCRARIRRLPGHRRPTAPHPVRRAARSPRSAGPPLPLPITPIDRRTARAMSLPGHAQQLPDLPAGISPASGPRAVRRRLGDGPMAPLKLASGCGSALYVLRHPNLPGLVRVTPTNRTAGRGPVARGARSPSCSSSRRTPLPTARISATSGCWRRSCPISPRWRAYDGCVSRTCNPPSCDRA